MGLHSGVTVIQFRKVSKNYDINGKETDIIDGIDLTIAESEIFGLVGETGSGKSTILRMMTGFIEPDGGGRIAGLVLGTGGQAGGQRQGDAPAQGPGGGRGVNVHGFPLGARSSILY